MLALSILLLPGTLLPGLVASSSFFKSSFSSQTEGWTTVPDSSYIKHCCRFLCYCFVPDLTTPAATLHSLTFQVAIVDLQRGKAFLLYTWMEVRQRSDGQYLLSFLCIQWCRRLLHNAVNTHHDLPRKRRMMIESVLMHGRKKKM